jgi:hypothetical protein
MKPTGPTARANDPANDGRSVGATPPQHRTYNGAFEQHANQKRIIQKENEEEEAGEARPRRASAAV